MGQATARVRPNASDAVANATSQWVSVDRFPDSSGPMNTAAVSAFRHAPEPSGGGTRLSQSSATNTSMRS